MLWASKEQPVALGLENKETTRKPRCCPLCGWAASSPFPGGPICVPHPLLGIFWAGWADFAHATQGLPALVWWTGSSVSPVHIPEPCIHMLPSQLSSGKASVNPSYPRRPHGLCSSTPLCSSLPFCPPGLGDRSVVVTSGELLPSGNVGSGNPREEQYTGWGRHSAWLRARAPFWWFLVFIVGQH